MFLIFLKKRDDFCYQNAILLIALLHIVNKGVDKNVGDVMSAQEIDNEVKLIKLTSDDINYAEIIDEIESADKVISWVTES